MYFLAFLLFQDILLFANVTNVTFATKYANCFVHGGPCKGGNFHDANFGAK